MNSITTIEKHIYNSFINAYTIDNIYYNARIINDIIYNEKSHIVAKFKDYLIIDDISEFLKRFYTSSESLIRLPKFFEYYETYSRIFPNYTALPESKFIYKNIHKKQKMIDKQQNMEMSMERNKLKQKNKNSKDNNDDNNNNVFNTEICCSIAEDSSLINEVFGMDKIKKKKKKKGNEINIGGNSNNNNNKSTNTSIDNKSVFEILKLINNIDVKQNRTKSQGHHALAISGNPSSVVQKDKRFTKQIKLHINETKRKGSNTKRTINNNNSNQNNNSNKPKTNNISKIKEGINNSVTNPKHRSTISSLLPKSKIDTYFFKNLTMNIFNEIHLNNSPIINNTINHSTSLFNNHNHTKSSNNIKNKCIFPFTYRNNNIKSETKTIKNIEAELIKNKIKKHSKTKTHHNRNRNCVISSNTKGQTQYNSEIIIGNIINNNNNTATHFRNSLSFINNNHSSNTPSSKCNVVNYKGVPNKKTILTNEKYFLEKFTKEFQTQKHFRHRSNETILKNNNSSRLQTDRPKNKVDIISLNQIMYQSNSNIKQNNQQPLTINKCIKKGRNNRNTNYTFRTNNVTNDTKKGMLLGSKDNYLFSNKITSPKEKTIIKGITINNFSKVLDVHKSKSNNNKAKTDRRNSNGYANKKK